MEKMSANDFRNALASGLISTGKKGRLSDGDGIFQKPKKRYERPRKVSQKIDPNYIPDRNLEGHIFIPGRVFSSKNNKRISTQFADGGSWKLKTKKGWVFVRPFIRDSEAASRYKKTTLPWYKAHKERFKSMLAGKEPPYYIEFVLVVPDRGRWDWNNLTQIVQDQMVVAGWVEDDATKFMLPVVPLPPRQPYIIHKGHEGVYIKVLDL